MGLRIPIRLRIPDRFDYWACQIEASGSNTGRQASAELHVVEAQLLADFDGLPCLEPDESWRGVGMGTGMGTGMGMG